MDEPIRILNLFTIMNRGGAETMVMNYYRNIDRTKVQFDFMVHRSQRGAYDDEIEALGGKIYTMPPIRPWSSLEYRKIIRKFYSEHPEYKIIHSHMSELGCYDFIEAQKMNVPVRICHAHSHPYEFDIKTPVRWYYKTKMMPHITHMFMCSETAGEWLYGKKNSDKFIMLNNAIDSEKYRYNEKIRAEVRKTLNIKDNQLVVGHVGRFNPPKNHEFIIDIFNQVHKKEKDAILLLVGDDSLNCGDKVHKKVERLGLNENVKFLGVRSDIPNLLQSMDVFLFPSLYEGLGIAAVEAQAAGLPTLISDRVPIECKKTDLVEVVSLKDSAQVWSEKVIECSRIKRQDMTEKIKAEGFDIKENSKWLQEFYLNCYNDSVNL